MSEDRMSEELEELRQRVAELEAFKASVPWDYLDHVLFDAPRADQYDSASLDRVQNWVKANKSENLPKITATVTFNRKDLDALLSGETITLPGVEFDNGETITFSGDWSV